MWILRRISEGDQQIGSSECITANDRVTRCDLKKDVFDGPFCLDTDLPTLPHESAPSNFNWRTDLQLIALCVPNKTVLDRLAADA